MAGNGNVAGAVGRPLDDVREIEARGGVGGVSPGKGGTKTRAERMAEAHRAPAVSAGECPDPLAPGAALALHALAFRRTWAVLADPRTSVQDVLNAYGVTRLAARVGADKVQVKRARLKTESILPAKAPPVDPKPG